jgi:hypothetical protein
MMPNGWGGNCLARSALANPQNLSRCRNGALATPSSVRLTDFTTILKRAVTNTVAMVRAKVNNPVHPALPHRRRRDFGQPLDLEHLATHVERPNNQGDMMLRGLEVACAPAVIRRVLGDLGERLSRKGNDRAMDPYRTLGVPIGCTRAEVKEAFRARVLFAHPDHGGEDSTFIQLRAAYMQIMEELDRRPTPRPDTNRPSRISPEDGATKPLDPTRVLDLGLHNEHAQKSPDPRVTWEAQIAWVDRVSARAVPGEPVISVVCGIPALAIGLGTIILLLAHLSGVPTGSEILYKFELVAVEARDGAGQVIEGVKPVTRLLPSVQLLAMLFGATCSAGLGINLSRRRGRRRRVTTSAAGLIACAMAFFLVWILFLVAAYP